MMILLLTLFAMCSQGTSDFLFRVGQGKGADRPSLIAISSPFFFLTALLLTLPSGGPEMTRTVTGLGFLSGALVLVAVSLFVKSLEGGDVTRSVMIYRLSFVLTVVLSVLTLAEPMTGRKAAGLLSAMGAVISLTLLGQRGPMRGSLAPAGLAFLAMTLYGVNQYLFKVATLRGASPTSLALAMSILFGSLGIPFALLRGGFHFLERPVLLWGGGAGMCQAFTVVSILLAFRLGGEASAVVPIVQMSFVVTAVLATLAYREPVTGGKLLALVLALLAVGFLSRAG
jgi:drug/metabolite transporter (DMT)-like permease